MFTGFDDLSRSFSEQANALFGGSLHQRQGEGGFYPGGSGRGARQEQQAPEAEQVPPPAALSFINGLRETTITSDDLIEENNKECLICLDEHALGGKAVKLPCGHIYHRDCVVEWLRKQGSCPVCRYEVESSDTVFEIGRKKRMQASRKMRMRKDELKAKKVSELRNIAHQLSINISGCIDKSEITDIMIASGKFDFTEGVPVQNIDEAAFQSMSVRELRQLLLSFGISDEGMLDKGELRGALVESGRIKLVESKEEEEGKEESRAACKMPPSPIATSPVAGNSGDTKASRNTSEMQVETPRSNIETEKGVEEAAEKKKRKNNEGEAAAPAPVNPNVLELGPDLVRSLSVRELKDIMTAYEISSDGCLERDDLLRRLADHPGVSLPEEER